MHAGCECMHGEDDEAALASMSMDAISDEHDDDDDEGAADEW